MSVIKTGVKAHDDTCLTAEVTRQAAAQAVGATPASIKTSEIAFYRTLRKSAIANGCGFEPFTVALIHLGVGGA